ncbi:glycosyltransferase [Micromonospora sp. BRA006-A]|nr:glycosyltransferase [Micromonospora sp. BRA006-A]
MAAEEATHRPPTTPRPPVTSRPDVSAVVPVYNTLRYLRSRLDSVLRQTIGADRVEIVAVDDGSTDGSGRLPDRYAAKHPGTVRVVHQSNSGGPASPCNRGLDLATGRYVFFLARTTGSARRPWSAWSPPPTGTARTWCSARWSGSTAGMSSPTCSPTATRST